MGVKAQGVFSTTPNPQQSQERRHEALTHGREQHKKDLFPTHTSAQGPTKSAGIAGHNVDTRALSRTWSATSDSPRCEETGTLSDSWHYFTHAGPFKVFLPQARPPRGPVCSEGLDSWSVRQSVVRAGGLKPGWLLLCKTATISELGVSKRLLWGGRLNWDVQEGRMRRPMPNSLEEWLRTRGAQPALTDAGMGGTREHLLSV